MKYKFIDVTHETNHCHPYQELQIDLMDKDMAFINVTSVSSFIKYTTRLLISYE